MPPLSYASYKHASNKHDGFDTENGKAGNLSKKHIKSNNHLKQKSKGGENNDPDSFLDVGSVVPVPQSPTSQE